MLEAKVNQLKRRSSLRVLPELTAFVVNSSVNSSALVGCLVFAQILAKQFFSAGIVGLVGGTPSGGPVVTCLVALFHLRHTLEYIIMFRSWQDKKKREENTYF